MTTPDPAAAPETDHGQSISAINDRIDRIEQALARLVPTTHAEAEAHTERRLDRPSTVEEQVQAELKRARAEDARKKADADRDTEVKSLKDELKALRETPPAEPVSRGSKIMGWA